MYNGADLMFLFEKGLSLTIRGRYYNSNTNFPFSSVSTQKRSKDGEWLQNNKSSLTTLILDFKFLFNQ